MTPGTRVGLVMAGLVGCTPADEVPLTFEVGLEQVVMTHEELGAAGLPTFPDGTLGVRWDDAQEQVEMWGANGRDPVRLTGSLRFPAESSVTPVSSSGAAADVAYAAGGPIHIDAGTGRMLQLQHVERHPNGYERFLSSLAVATAPDPGLELALLGEPILPSRSRAAAQDAVEVLEVGGGSLLAMGDDLLCLYTDYDGEAEGLALARAPAQEVLTAAAAGQASPWTKLGPEGWDQPGDLDGDRGGAAHIAIAGARWPASSYSAHLDAVLVVYTTGEALYLAHSVDGEAFSAPQLLASADGDELFYPSIVPVADDLAVTGGSVTGPELWVYYTRSATGGFGRWQDADWARRAVFLGG